MILLHAILLAGYVCGCIAVWMRLDESKAKVLHWLIPFLAAGHLALLILLHDEAEGYGLSFTVPAFALAVLVLGWIQNAAWPVYGTYRVILPLCLASLVVPLAAVGHGKEAAEPSPAFWIHIVSATAAYALAVLAFLLMLVRRFESGHLADSLEEEGKVPLLMIERLAMGNIYAGLGILTVTLASGIYITMVGQHSALELTHKNLFAFLTWLVLIVFVSGHRIQGWRNKTALAYMGLGLAFLLLSYFGTSFVLQVILEK